MLFLAFRLFQPMRILSQVSCPIALLRKLDRAGVCVGVGGGQAGGRQWRERQSTVAHIGGALGRESLGETRWESLAVLSS